MVVSSQLHVSGNVNGVNATAMKLLCSPSQTGIAVVLNGLLLTRLYRKCIRTCINYNLHQENIEMIFFKIHEDYTNNTVE